MAKTRNHLLFTRCYYDYRAITQLSNHQAASGNLPCLCLSGSCQCERWPPAIHYQHIIQQISTINISEDQPHVQFLQHWLATWYYVTPKKELIWAYATSILLFLPSPMHSQVMIRWTDLVLHSPEELQKYVNFLLHHSSLCHSRQAGQPAPFPSILLHWLRLPIKSDESGPSIIESALIMPYHSLCQLYLAGRAPDSPSEPHPTWWSVAVCTL